MKPATQTTPIKQQAGACADAAHLRAAVALAARVADPRATMPILGALRVEADAGALRVEAHDLRTWIEVTCEADGALAPILADPRALTAAIGTTKKGAPARVAFGATDGTLTVERDGRRFALRAPCPVRDFPVAPTAPSGDTAIYGAELADALDWTLPAASTDDTRPQLCCVNFTAGVAVASDGHRLHAHEGMPRFDALLSRGTCEALRAALAATGADRVSARAGAGHVAYRCEGRGLGVTVIGRRVDAAFPSHDQVVPREHDGTAHVAASALREAVTTARAFLRGSRERAGIKCEFAPGTLDLSVERSDAGAFAETIKVGGDARGTLGLDVGYLSDALALDGELSIGVSGPLDAITVRAAGDPRFAVLMPMRI